MERFTEVYVWGGNREGQLGLGDKERGKRHETPKHCSFCIRIKHVSCGDLFTCLLASTGHVYTMGSNLHGRLGLNDSQIPFTSSPSLVPGPTSIISVHCGVDHTLIYTETGDIYTWGCNQYGALGTGDLEHRYHAVKIEKNINETVKGAACGWKNAVFWGGEGEVKGCGAGEILGLGNQQTCLTFTRIPLPEPVKQASIGENHGAYVSVLGRVFTTGSNMNGELGVSTQKSTAGPVLVLGLEGISVQKVTCSVYTTALTSTGDLYVWGPSPFGQYLSPYKVSSFPRPILDINQSALYGTAVDMSGQLWVWGDNTQGTLGLGDFMNRKTPFPVTGLMEKCVREVGCGTDFVVALGRDIKPVIRKRSTGMETVRMRKCSPALDSIESARSTSRIHPGNPDFDSTASSKREKAGFEPLYNLLQSHISQLATELHGLQQRFAQTTQSLYSEQQAKKLLETQLVAVKSGQQSLETSQIILPKKVQENFGKMDRFYEEIPSSSSPSLHVTTEFQSGEIESSKRLQRDYARLQEALERSEEHNRELLQELDRRSVKKARDFREKSLCVLASPSPIKRPPLMTFDSNLQLPTFRETGCRPLSQCSDSQEGNFNPFRRNSSRNSRESGRDKV